MIFLLKTVPITFSNGKTWGLSARGVLRFEIDGDWWGIFGMVSVVEDTRGEVRDEVLGAHLASIAETWFIVEEFGIDLIEQLSDWFVEL